jgi:hypothetical protein
MKQKGRERRGFIGISGRKGERMNEREGKEGWKGNRRG